MRKDQDGASLNFTDLHNRLYGAVFSFVRLRIKDKEEVQDIVQDVFLKAYNSWTDSSSGIPDEKTAKNFLYIMARQRMIDIWRSSRSRFQTDLLNTNQESALGEDGGDFDALAGDEPLPEDLFVQNENKDLVVNLLNKLKKEEREILMLRFLDELEYKELARIYKTSEDNIRQKVSRSLQNLKKVANNNTNKI